MPYYRAILVNEQGKFLDREIYAANRADARSNLAGGEEKLLRLRWLFQKNLKLGRWLHKRIGYTDFLLFNQELITLLRAGIPFIRALEIIIQNTKNSRLEQLLRQTAADIRNGTQISESFPAGQIPFARIYKASLLAGEKSGHLEAVLEKFNTYLAKITNLRRKTISSLTYPVVLLVFMICMLLIITMYVIPKFSSFYESFETSLPDITIFFISLAGFLRDRLWLILLVLAGGYTIIKLIEKYNPRVIILDQAKTRLPLIGTIIHQNAVAVFARTLAILVAGGIPVPEASQIAVETFANRFFYSQVSHVPDQIQHGNPLSAVLGEIAIIPNILTEMARVGESSGNLSGIMDEAADYFERSIDSKINSLISLIEPVIIISLGLVIALMLISVYLPIFSTIRVIR